MRSKRAERLDIHFEFGIAGGDMRQLLVRIASGAAMAGHMLETANDPRPAQPVEHRPAERGDLQRVAAQRTIPDDIVGFGAPDIEWRMEIDGDPHGGQFAAHGFGIGAGGLDRRSGGDVPQGSECFTRGIGLPHRRFHPGDPVRLPDRSI